MILTPRLLLTPPAGCPDPAEQSSTTTTAGDQAAEERRPEGVPSATCPRRRATEPPETIALHAGDAGPSTPWRDRPETTKIAVSPVRVRVSPSKEALQSCGFCN